MSFTIRLILTTWSFLGLRRETPLSANQNIEVDGGRVVHLQRDVNKGAEVSMVY